MQRESGSHAYGENLLPALPLLRFLDRFDRTLGGLEMELRLREHLAGLFNEQRKGQRTKDVRENPRAMAKLLREANRLKTVLSANADHMAQVPTQGQ